MSFTFALPFLLIAAIAYLLLSMVVRYSTTLRHLKLRTIRKARATKKRWNRAYSLKTSYPVKYASRRSSLLRLVPWEARGTLSESDDGIHFEGSSPLGKRFELDFDPDETTVNYQQGRLWWDGGLSWCVIESEGEKHYFTSEAVDAEKSSSSMDDGFGTTDIYQHLTNRYIKLN